MATPEYHSPLLRIALILSITLLGLSGCKKDEANTNVDHHLYLAESYVNQGQLNAAILEAKTVLQANPGNPHAIFVISKTMAVSGDHNSAEIKLSELTKSDPTNKDYVFALVDTLIALKKQHSALFELTEYEKAGGTLNAEFYALKGDVTTLSGEFSDAKKLYNKSLDISQNHTDSFLGLAKIAHLEKKIQEREAFSKKALDSSPNHLKTWLWKAAVAMEEKEYYNAEIAFSNALLEMQQFDTMTATKYLTLNGMVKALIAQGKTEDALRYSDTLSHSPQGKLQSSFKDAIGSFKSGDVSAAEETFKEIFLQAPGHGATGTALGIISYNKGDLVEAEKYLSRALAGGDDVPIETYKLLAITRLKLSQAKDSIDIINNGLKAFGESADLYSIQGIAYNDLEMPSESRAAYNKALKLDPTNVAALLSLASLNADQKRYTDAWNIYDNFLNRIPTHIIALQGAAAVSAADNKLDRALNRIKAIAKANPNHPNPAIVLGVTYLKQREFSDALIYGEQALKIDPNSKAALRLLTTAHYAVARNLLAEEDLPGALTAIRKAYELSPNSVTIMLAIVNLQVRTDKIETAKNIAEEFIKANPERHEGHEVLGDISIKLNDFSAAATNLKKAWGVTQNHLLGMKLFRAQNALRQDEDAVSHLTQWTSSSNLPESYFTLAMAYQEMKQPAKAIPQYEAVLQIQPDHIITLNNIAWLYQEAGNENALRIGKKAYELAPKSAAVADTYGWILVLNGQKTQGIEILEKAAKIDPSNKDVQKHIEEAKGK